MKGVIEIASGDLIKAGFTTFIAVSGVTEIRMNVPYPAFVKHNSQTTRYHRWTGAEWEVVEIPSVHGVITELIGTTYVSRDPSAWPGDGQLLRLAPAAYEDGENVPPTTGRPSPRAISNAVCSQTGEILNELNCTDMFWIWGQFIDHDISLTGGNSAEPLNISVPTGDPEFDPTSTGTATIAFERSIYTPGTGSGGNPREQVTHISSFIDATNVYGTNETRNTWLRTNTEGKLRVGQANVPPTNDGSMDNAGPSGSTAYVVGDVRGNEHTGLLSVHTVFLREHNWWAAKIFKANPSLTDEEIYRKARVIIESEVQQITWNEFLPLLLGSEALSDYTGYQSGVNPQIANEFSTAAYRLGHSLVSDTLWRLSPTQQPIQLGHLPLKDAFFNPSKYNDEGGIDPVLQGACKHICQKLDIKVVDNLRNFLFGDPGNGGHDLPALNIQRGRDHGLSDYNSTRVALSLPAKATFADITSDADLASALSSVYGGDIAKIDLFVGGLCEDRVSGSQLGELFHTIVLDQFTRLRNSDPMWYETRLSSDLQTYINNTRLSTILKRNTGVKGIQEYVMLTF